MKKPVFRIKICGVTSPADALRIAAAGADALGLNFYPGSQRFVELEQARAIVNQVPSGVVKVGLFVNASAEHVAAHFDTLGLDLIQLHGDEPPETLAQLRPRPVMRAFRLDTRGVAPIEEYLDRCQELDCLPRLVLIDAFDPNRYGGTGQTADWNLLAGWQRSAEIPHVVLAGGLTAENVAQAIRTVRPGAVDTASGVESTPGQKDAQLVQAFVSAANRAFGQTGN